METQQIESVVPKTSDKANDPLALLSIRNCHKRFGQNEVLKGVTLNVTRGQVVGIIGGSGGGKSTLLRCATLLEHMDGGSLAYGDLTVATDEQGQRSIYGNKTVLAEAKRRFGLVFQNFNLFPHFTVLKNVMDPLVSVKKVEKDAAHKKALEVLGQMGLAEKADMVPCELSGGQQQRVAIARALAMEPEVLFFDEPTSALDPELTQEVLKVIRDLAASHMTMVIVTHEMMFARDVADHIAFMDGGTIVEEGPAASVIDNPQHNRTRAFLSRMAD